MDLPGVPSVLLDALRDAASACGQPRLALVGGVVRDLMLHRHHRRPWNGVPDLDWVVEGDVAQIVAVLLERCGPRRVRSVQPHAAFGTVALHLDEVPLDLAMARQERYPEPGWNPVVQPGSLETDLLRRDFTINAMALDLASGELLDPHGGLEDLAANLLEFLHQNSVSDDPTRVSRAARYGARLGTDLSPEARRQVERTIDAWPWTWHFGEAPEAAPPALASRLRMEVDRLLEHEPWPEALNLLADWGAMALLDPGLQDDPERMRRMHWGQRMGLPLLPVWLAGASDPAAVARRLQIPGQQQQWLNQLLPLQAWLSEQAPSRQASPGAWTMALEQRGWSPETVALMVSLRPPCWKQLLRWWGRWRLIQSPETARQLIADGWTAGPALGEELRRRRRARLDQCR